MLFSNLIICIGWKKIAHNTADDWRPDSDVFL